MTRKNYLLQGIGLSLLLILMTGQTRAQSDLVASTDDAVSVAEEQGIAAAAEESIIVDTDSEVNAYPSMEEEMRMYIQLKKDYPQVYCFPNPSNGVVWIEHNLGESVSVSISDGTGDKVYRASDLKAVKLELSNLEAGNYVLEVSNKEHSITKSLVVK